MRAALVLRSVFALIPLLLPSFASAQIELGHAARAPKDLTKLGPAFSPSDFTVNSGFAVNSDSREQVRAFYNGIFYTSDNVPMNNSSDVANCSPGANSADFVAAVQRRINWYRAMAGIPAAITLDPTYNAGSQLVAEMISANGVLNHNPPTNFICYTDTGHQYAGGNQAGGENGPDAITGYIWDFGNGNNEVGHRRWILLPQTAVMGTGDFPLTTNGDTTNIAGNSVWVFDASINNPRPATRQPYVSWPPEGYLPYQLAFPYWSFAVSNANVSAAAITMKSNGVPVSLIVQPQTNGYGENTVVWVPMGLDANCQCTTFPFNGTDTVYSVTVSNVVTVTSGVTNTNSYAYNVTLFDPAVPGADYIAPTVNGSTQPTVGGSNVYSVTPINSTNVTSYQWIISQLTNGNLTDQANNGLVNFTFSPATDYSVITNSPDGSGSNCFHLCDDDNSPQILQLNETLYPATNTTVSFLSYLGFSTTDETSRVQVSTNGVDWQDLFTQAGCDAQCAPSFVAYSLSLSNYAGQPTMLRFDYDLAPGGEYYPGTGQSSTAFGWCLEDIVVTNTSQLLNTSTNLVASTNLVSGTFIDNANNGLTNFTLTPSPNYPGTVSAPDGSGSNCFHLCDDNATSQMLQLNNTLLPATNTTLSFGSLLGYSTSDETAQVQVSTNGGTNWLELYSQSGCGSNGDYPMCESSFTPHTLSLSNFAGMPTLLRFAYTYDGGTSFPDQDAPYIGWCVENIVITNSRQYVVTILNTTNFNFTPAQTGSYLLQAVPVIFGQFPLSAGPVKLVTAIAPSGIKMNQPVISGTNVQLNFTVSGGLTGTFKLLQASQPNAVWTTNTTAALTTNVPGTSFRFTTTNGPNERFYRVQLTPGS